MMRYVRSNVPSSSVSFLPQNSLSRRSQGFTHPEQVRRPLNSIQATRFQVCSFVAKTPIAATRISNRGFARKAIDMGPVSINRGSPFLLSEEDMKTHHPFAYYVAPPPEPKPRIPTQEEHMSEGEFQTETERVESLLAEKFKDKDLAQVEELDLEDAKIGDLGVKILIRYLKKMKKLKVLDLENNNIGPHGAKNLSIVLKSHPTLEELDLEDNPIGPEGTKWICKMMMPGKTGGTRPKIIPPTPIKILDLEGCQITDAGAIHLYRMLKNSPTIFELDLEDNDFGDRGANYIGRGIRWSKSLHHIDLSYNKIKDDGVWCLARAVRRSDTAPLATLKLESNLIGERGINELIRFTLSWNRTITQLYVEGNPYPVDDELRKILRHKLARNVCKRKGLVGPGGRLKPGVVLPKVILFNKKWAFRRPEGLPIDFMKLGESQMLSGKWKLDAATPVLESEVEEPTADTAAVDAEEEKVLAEGQQDPVDDDEDEADIDEDDDEGESDTRSEIRANPLE